MSEVRPVPLENALWRPIPCVVRRVVRECADTVTLTLAPVDVQDQALAQRIEPGQFFMLYRFAHGEAPISVSGVLPEEGWIEQTIKGNGALTIALTALVPGDLVGLRGPFGQGWPLAQARGRDLVLVAGGIGFAPLRSALQAIRADRNVYGHIDLVYGARTPADILFQQELAGLEDVAVHLIVDHGGPGWDGQVGFVSAKLEVLQPAANAIALVCGPEVMMRHVLTQLMEKGLTLSNIYLSMERNMKCAIGLCGHCQWGADFVCRQGPVFPASRIRARLQISEL